MKDGSLPPLESIPLSQRVWQPPRGGRKNVGAFVLLRTVQGCCSKTADARRETTEVRLITEVLDQKSVKSEGNTTAEVFRTGGTNRVAVVCGRLAQ